MFSSVSVFNPAAGVQLPPPVLRTVFASSQTPLVVKNQLQPWIVRRSWKAVDICNTLGGETATFKVCPRKGSKSWENQFGNSKDVVFETQCVYIEAKFTDFVEWLSLPELHEHGPSKRKKLTEDVTLPNSSSVSLQASLNQVNPLLDFPRSEFWVYADYKYMRHLCSDYPDLLSSVNWSLLGFEGRSGKDSAIWIGSEGSYTPCHYDTYGCNVVAQLAGGKKWMLFSPSDTKKLYPTRVPYEESSVFSNVNVGDPDLLKHPLFSSATCFSVTLQPGDVLYVPKHWWHYVESVSAEPTVSVNMWIEQETFPHERVKEAVARTLVSQFSVDLPDISTPPEWINPNEELFSTKENMRLVSKMLHERKLQLVQATADSTTAHPCVSEQTSISEGHDYVKLINVQDFVRAVTSDPVITLISDILLDQHCK